MDLDCFFNTRWGLGKISGKTRRGSYIINEAKIQDRGRFILSRATIHDREHIK